MKLGGYALFTDGSHTERRPNPAGVTDSGGEVIWDEEKAGWGVQVIQKGKYTHAHQLPHRWNYCFHPRRSAPGSGDPGEGQRHFCWSRDAV